MVKLIQSVLTALLVSICSTSPARLDKLIPSKSKFLARQEVAEDIPAQTPYPPAGIRPEVPFNLPTDEKVDTVDILTSGKVVAPADYYLPPIFEAPKFSALADVNGPPAETYGPPEVSANGENNDATKDDAQSEETQPDEAQREEAQQDALSKEIQPEEIQSSQKPVEEELEVDSKANAVPEQEVSEVEQFGTAEKTQNKLLGRIVLAKKSNDSKAEKLQTLQPVSAQQFFLIDGKLYALRA